MKPAKPAFKARGLLAFLIFFSPGVWAQAPSSAGAPYILPQTIFVGDSGRLVVPLGETFPRPFVLETPELLPQTPDLVIRRIELERRGGNSRLLIDFVPYAPGTLSFPDLDFLFREGGAVSPAGSPPENPAGEENPAGNPSRGEDSRFPPLTGLEVHVASILTPSQMTLADPAPPLSVPGTSLLVYGAVVLVLAALSAGIGSGVWGRRYFSEFWEKLGRRRLLRAMMKFLKRARQETGGETAENPGRYLTLLAARFREFLSSFTGIDCRSLAAGEFLGLRFEHASAILTPDGLCRMFRAWDTLRFSGRAMEKAELFQALDETEKLIAALDRAEREKMLPRPPRNALSPPQGTPEPAALTGENP